MRMMREVGMRGIIRMIMRRDGVGIGLRVPTEGVEIGVELFTYLHPPAEGPLAHIYCDTHD